MFPDGTLTTSGAIYPSTGTTSARIGQRVEMIDKGIGERFANLPKLSGRRVIFAVDQEREDETHIRIDRLHYIDVDDVLLGLSCTLLRPPRLGTRPGTSPFWHATCSVFRFICPRFYCDRIQHSREGDGKNNTNREESHGDDSRNGHAHTSSRDRFSFRNKTQRNQTVCNAIKLTL